MLFSPVPNFAVEPDQSMVCHLHGERRGNWHRLTKCHPQPCSARVGTEYAQWEAVWPLYPIGLDAKSIREQGQWEAVWPLYPVGLDAKA